MHSPELRIVLLIVFLCTVAHTGLFNVFAKHAHITSLVRLRGGSDSPLHKAQQKKERLVYNFLFMCQIHNNMHATVLIHHHGHDIRHVPADGAAY